MACRQQQAWYDEAGIIREMRRWNQFINEPMQRSMGFIRGNSIISTRSRGPHVLLAGTFFNRQGSILERQRALFSELMTAMGYTARFGIEPATSC